MVCGKFKSTGYNYIINASCQTHLMMHLYIGYTHGFYRKLRHLVGIEFLPSSFYPALSCGAACKMELTCKM
jgi:hypothetical protein